ncbi:class I SAM-dependent methyltransferase [Photobacterium sp. TY1-4]|uniref:class I SAM-dependent methyltransferase n=1 Tax=Photobacterium sp. TY1-4 TaxID=2899122 RepID=UPI0021BE18ED|nr:class I SAM-dependent methyltransferase [Photobacterium sp. TY1-4]UXI01402.1 class I SAM-dependent methyltransferase [Photobacterium sp. TY1-4]
MTKTSRYHIPTALLQPLWLRSRESLEDEGLIYDPVAAAACNQCHFKADCLTGNVPARQLLHATLTLQCDRLVQQFLRRHPNGWIINVGAGLDTRFYRLDNGRCRWFELDTDENLLWRERLFHRSERYTMRPGSVTDLSWLKSLPVMGKAPVLLLCDQALLQCNDAELARFVQQLGCHFSQIEVCLVVAGDRCGSALAARMGSGSYQHGYKDPVRQILSWLPWAELIGSHSPLDHACPRWRPWQRWLAKVPSLKYRITPVLVHFRL